MKREITSLQNQTLFQVSWPIFFEISMHMGTGIIATFMLAHYSDFAASAVGVANQVLNIFVLALEVTGIGASILISQAIGANNKQRRVNLIKSSVAINFWIGALLACFLFIFGKYLLLIFNIEAQTFEYAQNFLQIVGISLFFESLALVLSAILKSHGYLKEALFATILLNIICIIGNVISIYGLLNLPKFGVEGVAITIVIARFSLVLLLLFFVKTKIRVKLELQMLVKIKKDNVKDLLSIGIPSAGEALSYHLSQIIITAFITSMGAATLAARVYLVNISMLCYLFAVAVAHGSQLLVARYAGAGRFTELYQRGMKSQKIAILSSFCVSLIIAINGKNFLSLFTQDSEILAVSLPVLWLIAFIEPGKAANIVLIGCLKSASDVKFPVVIGLISMWGVATLFSYILGIHFSLGLLGVWIAQGMDEWFRCLFANWRWHKRPWEKHFSKMSMGFENK
ncbi:MAG: MATE family efflux transporter [Lactovum sp.]